MPENSEPKEGLQDLNLETIFDLSPVAIFVKDRENRFIRVNDNFARIMGMNKKELDSKSIFDIYPKEQALKYWEDDKEVMSLGHPKKGIIEPLSTPVGVRWIETHKVPYIDGKGAIKGVVGFAVDITAMVEANKKVTKTVDQLNLIFNSISDPIFILDAKHNIIKANKASGELLKKDPSEIVGKKCYEVMHKMCEPWHNCPHGKTCKDKQPHTEEVDDPAIGRPLLVSISPIFDEYSSFIGSVHVAKDISDRRRIEDELKRKIESLEKFQKVTVDRELRMKELKAEIAKLKEGKTAGHE